MKKILVVDDVATVRQYHREILEAIGFHVDEAINGIEALEKTIGGNYDLLIVDVNMPMMDGYTFLRALRQEADCRSIPVMIVSSASKPQERDLAYQAGANIYKNKPLTPAELKSITLMLTGSA